MNTDIARMNTDFDAVNLGAKINNLIKQKNFVNSALKPGVFFFLRVLRYLRELGAIPA